MAKWLIDSAELIEKLPIVDEDRQISLIGAVADVVGMISECQPVDAVEVVRCRDCKWFTAEITLTGRRYHCDHFRGMAVPSACDFCSCGERRPGDELP